MRIAVDTQSTLGFKTGIGIYTAALLAALRRTAPQHEYVALDWGRDRRMRFDRRLRWQQIEEADHAVHAPPTSTCCMFPGSTRHAGNRVRPYLPFTI